MNFFAKLHSGLLTALILFGVCAFSPVQAQVNLGEQISGQINASARTAEVRADQGDPQYFIINAIRVFLSILGIFFMVLTIMSGYWWATARGDEGKVDKAKKTLRSAVIGLGIILAAYSITNFIGNAATDVVSSPQL